MNRLYLLQFSDFTGQLEYVVFTEDPVKQWRKHAKPGCTLDSAFDLTFAEPVRATGRRRKHFTLNALPLDIPLVAE